MSLFAKYDASKKKRRWLPPTDPDKIKNLKRAQQENFAIYLLTGRSTHFFHDVLPAKMIRDYNKMQKDMIAYIKTEQEKRKQRRGK